MVFWEKPIYTILVGISFVQFGTLMSYHTSKAFDQIRKESIQNLNKMNTPHTPLAVPKGPERH